MQNKYLKNCNNIHLQNAEQLYSSSYQHVLELCVTVSLVFCTRNIGNVSCNAKLHSVCRNSEVKKEMKIVKLLNYKPSRMDTWKGIFIINWLDSKILVYNPASQNSDLWKDLQNRPFTKHFNSKETKTSQDSKQKTHTFTLTK